MCMFRGVGTIHELSVWCEKNKTGDHAGSPLRYICLRTNKRERQRMARKENNMIKKLWASVREFKKPAIYTLLLIVGEAIFETIIPFITAGLVNDIRKGTDIRELLGTGLLLVIMACASLMCGGLAGFTCSKASAGFAKNLRSDMFRAIQRYSFENIDKFSSASLVTRLTTDVTNIQNAYQMILRMAVRAPFSLIVAMIMAFSVSPKMASVYLIAVIILGIILAFITGGAFKYFSQVFKKYTGMTPRQYRN